MENQSLAEETVIGDAPTKRPKNDDEAERSPRRGRSLAPGAPRSGPSRLRQYLNARVTIHYNTYSSGYQDSGTLTLMDETWVELTKDNQERLLIPIVSIRIIKLLAPSEPEDDSTVLLRPFEGPLGEQKLIEE